MEKDDLHLVCKSSFDVLAMIRRTNHPLGITQRNVKMKTSNASGIAKMLDHRAEVNDFRQANAKCRRAFWNGAIRYDNPFKDEYGDDREDHSLSDRGKGAATVRELGDDPAWLTEFNRVVDSLEGTEAKVVDALFQDMRPAYAARIAGVSRPTVYKVIASMREKLSKAHTLWKSEE